MGHPPTHRRLLLGALLVASMAGVALADVVPIGGPALDRLLGPRLPDRATLEQAIARDGFYAGEPIGVGACARCHPDVVEQWSASAHRFASFNNPYYAATARRMPREVGPLAFRFCADCHDPAVVVADQIFRVDEASAAAQAGIGCLVCHSVHEAPPPTGNGDYQARLDPLKFGAEHGARMRPAGVEGGQLCGSCHRVGIKAGITSDRFHRGQDDAFDWYDSPYAGRGVRTPFTTEPKTCVDCHMPRVAASAAEKGARDGLIRDHRVLAAGTALARVRGDAKHQAATEETLRGRVRLALAHSVPGAIDVVMVNDQVGHHFPGGANDSNQAWLAWRVRDAAGAVIGVGGQLGPDGALSPSTHLIRSQAVDADARPVAQRAGWTQRGVIFDHRLPPLAPRMTRLALPAGARSIEVRLHYRQFGLDLARFACDALPAGDARDRCLSPPVTEIARVTADLDDRGRPPRDTAWRALTEHGLALAEGLAGDLRHAERVLKQAAEAAPKQAAPWLARARAAWALGQTDAALALLDRADALPNAPAMRHWLRAQIALDAYRLAPARAAAEALLAEHPTDREALRLAARTRGLTDDARGQLAAADALLAIDPEDPPAYHQRALALDALGQPDAAAQARRLWSELRVDQSRNARLRQASRAHSPARAPALDPIPRWPTRPAVTRRTGPPD